MRVVWRQVFPWSAARPFGRLLTMGPSEGAAAGDDGERWRPAAGDDGERWRPPAAMHPRHVNCIPKSRDFH